MLAGRLRLPGRRRPISVWGEVVRRQRPCLRRRHCLPLPSHLSTPNRSIIIRRRCNANSRIISCNISSSSSRWSAPNRNRWIPIIIILQIIATMLASSSSSSLPILPLLHRPPFLPLIRRRWISWITAAAIKATRSLHSTRSSTPITPPGGPMKCFPAMDTGLSFVSFHNSMDDFSNLWSDLLIRIFE